MELSPYDEDSNIKCSLTDLIFTNTKIIDKSKHWSLILFQESFAVNSKNTWKDNLAAIFEAKLKAAIDNRGVKKWQFSNAVFDPKIWPF